MTNGMGISVTAKAAAGSLVGMTCLVPFSAAADAEFPAVLAGSWTRQAGSGTANPGVITMDDESVAIDGERCTVESVRALHAHRWYIDFNCGVATAPARLWLDINLLAEDRMLLNRRPLAEADIYVRSGRGRSSKDGAK